MFKVSEKKIKIESLPMDMVPDEPYNILIGTIEHPEDPNSVWFVLETHEQYLEFAKDPEATFRYLEGVTTYNFRILY